MAPSSTNNSFLLLVCFCICSSVISLKQNQINIEAPHVLLSNVEFSLTLDLPEIERYDQVEYEVLENLHILARGVIVHNNMTESIKDLALSKLLINHYGKTAIHARIYSISNSTSRNQPKQLIAEGTIELFSIPAFLSLIPAILTLLVAALSGHVIIGLFMGIWCGATFIHSFNPFLAFLRTFDTYWLNAFTDEGHSGVLLFTILLGGTIGLVSKSGGGHGLAQELVKFMVSRTKMQMFTWSLCLFIFFDDYSCILIIGSSLRGVLQQTGVSKEKFAAIVHSIGVCLPSLAPVSGWIGVEIGYVGSQIKHLGIDADPFMTCLRSLPYRLFPVLMIAFVLIVILFDRDFGPMLTYEQEALDRKSCKALSDSINTGVHLPLEPGPLDPKLNTPLRWINAVLPFSFIIFATFGGMIWDGLLAIDAIPLPDRPESNLTNALSHSNSIAALIRSSAGGWAVALVLILSQKILTIGECMDAWIQGIKEILEPTIVLLLAWALGNVIGDIQAAAFLSSLLQNGLSPSLLPCLSALLCYIVSFAIGSSFGTMAIMFPIVCPITYTISNGDQDILLQAIGSVLGGSVFGNVCSPIADTTILTCLATGTSLTNHIQTILPYVSVVAIVSLLCASLPVGFGFYSIFTAYIVCLTVLIVVVSFVGKSVSADSGTWSPYSDGQTAEVSTEKVSILHG